MHILLWLFAGPTLALFALWGIGITAPLTALGAALGAQALAYLVWQRVERRRTALALRRLRRQPGVIIMRVRFSFGEAVVQQGLPWVVAAGLATAAFLTGAG
jgi:membrane protease YdiL (CAAX protease family)